VLFSEKADQSFQVDFGIVLRYIALLNKKWAKVMNNVIAA
jgi:hypothetical protein